MAVKTILSPYRLKGNISFDIKRKYLEENGFDVSRLSTELKHLFSGCRIANLNFYETSYTDSLVRCVLDYIVKVLILKLMKIRNVRIIYTMHNKVGHDSRFPKIEISMMKRLFKTADKIVILCDESKNVIKKMMINSYPIIENKIVKIPLVSYEDAYLSRDENIRKKYCIPQNKMLFTFMGGIRKYKNIEYIIEAAEAFSDVNDAIFLIAGSGDKQYISELKRTASNISNIIIRDEYIPNEDMADLAYGTDIFIFPLDLKSSLNSGACMYAFSFGRNVVCPNIGTIKELDNQVCYSYDYHNENEHRRELINKCKQAYDEWKNDRNTFCYKQSVLLEESRSKNSVEVIAYSYKTLYNSLL